MSTLTLSGWTQPADALAHLADDALLFDYSDYTNPEGAIEALQKVKADYVIAWSMGAQLAIRAMMAGVLKVQHATLIAPPARFVSDEVLDGMDPLTYQLFRDSYASDPARTAARFHALLAKGDSEQKQILKAARHHPEVENTARWLPWLEAMAAYKMDISRLEFLPPTLIIHGMNDAIIKLTQSEYIERYMADAQLNPWAETGHAPHLHDPSRVKAEIEEHRLNYEVA